MNLISKAEFARTISVSAPYVDKLCKSGKITLTQDGKKQKVDLHGSKTLKFLAARESAVKPIIPKPTEQKKKEQQPSAPPPPRKPPSNNPSGLAGVTGTEAQKDLKEENLELKNEKLKIDIGQTRTKLIEKALVVSVFGQLDSIDENQLKALAVRVGPKIEESLAETYDGKTKELLTLLGREDDTHLKADIQKIMNSGGASRVRRFTEIIEEDTGKILKNIQRVFDKFLESVNQ